MEEKINKTPLIIDIPSYIEFYIDSPSHFVKKKVFEYIDKYGSQKYLKDYIICYNHYGTGSKYVKKLIDDWDLDYFTSGKLGDITNADKVNTIKRIIERAKGGEALIFFSYPSRDLDIGNKIMLHQIDNEHSIYLKTCRLDHNGSI